MADALNFDSLVGSHQRAVLDYLRRRVRDYHAAEDLCQETFLRALKSRSRGGLPPQPRPWLLRTAKHLAIDYCRRKDAPALDIDFLADVVVAQEPQEEARLVFEGRHLSKPRVLEAVCEGLSELPANYRRPVLHRYRDGRAYWEVALRNGLSMSSAKVRLHRGRRRLKNFVLSRMRDPQFSCEKSA